MSLPRVLALVASLGAAACLAAGLAAAGRPWAALAVLPLALSGAVAPFLRGAWLPTLCLVAGTAAAAGGLACGAPPVLALLGAAGALASWDLALLAQAAAPPARGAAPPPSPARHLLALALGLAPGLALACLGRLVRLELPFVAMLALAAVAVVGLERVVRWRG